MSHEILMEKMVKLLNQDTTMIDLPARCVGQIINLIGTYIIDLGIGPAIISASDSDLVGNRTFHPACLEKKFCNTNRPYDFARFSGNELR